MFGYNLYPRDEAFIVTMSPEERRGTKPMLRDDVISMRRFGQSRFRCGLCGQYEPVDANGEFVYPCPRVR